MSLSRVNRLIHCGGKIVALVMSVIRPVNLRVYLGQDGPAVCAISGRFRPAVRTSAVLHTTPTAGADRNGIEASLAALSTWLHTHSFRGTINWVLGIDHVRYLILPWDERLLNKSFCNTLAAVVYTQQLSADDVPFAAHHLRFAPLSRGRPLLAALVKRTTINEIEQFSYRHRCRTGQISTTLNVVWDRFFGRVKNDAGILALVEGQRLLRVKYDRGNVMSLSVQPYSEKLAPPSHDTATYRFPPQRANEPAENEWTLRGSSLDTDSRFAFALCGIF